MGRERDDLKKIEVRAGAILVFRQKSLALPQLAIAVNAR